MELRARLTGIDLARAVAVVGMVLVHAQSDLVLPPLEQAAGGREVPAPPAPVLLELLQGALTNRARLLFLLLAGVGVALLARRGVRARTLLRRAGFLAALGVLLVVLGWSDLVLLFYGVLFALAPVVLRLPSAALLLLAAAVQVPAAAALARDPGRLAGSTGVLGVLAEAVGLFCLGVVVGRADLAARAAPARLAAVGLAVSAPGLVVLAARRALDVTEVDGAVELLAATTSTAGLCLAVVGGCLLAGRPPGRGVRSLAVAGSMPLSAYTGHALLFPRAADAVALDLPAATGVAVAYLLLWIALALAWRRRHGAGPLEALLRRTAGT